MLSEEFDYILEKGLAYDFVTTKTKWMSRNIMYMCVWNKRCLPAVSPHDLQDKRPLVAIKNQK